MNLTSQVKDCIIRMLQNFKNYDYFSENYALVTETPIGKGGFGDVYEVRCRRTATNEVLAMKEIRICYEENYSDESISQTSGTDEENILDFVQCCQEAVLQSEVFKHPHIVAVHDKWIQQNRDNSKDSSTYADDILTIVEFLQSDGQGHSVNILEITPTVREALVNTEGLCFYLTMDLYDMNLGRWMSTREQIPNAKEEIIRQLTDALSYIHSEKGYCHLDLTPANILIKEENGTKAAIADFGLSQLYESPILQTSEGRPGKAPYNSAPDEYLTDKFDIWSFGLIVYEILNVKGASHSELVELCEHAKTGGIVLGDFVTSNITDINFTALRFIVLDCLKQTEERPASKDLHGKYFDASDLTSTNDSDRSAFNEDAISYISTGSTDSLQYWCKTPRDSRRDFRRRTISLDMDRLSISSNTSQSSDTLALGKLTNLKRGTSIDRHDETIQPSILEMAAQFKNLLSRLKLKRHMKIQ